MKKILCLILALALAFSLAACGETPAQNANETETPAQTEETRVYKYEEDHGAFTIKWTVELEPDGTFRLTEINGMSNDVGIHTGKSWTDNGNGTFTTGAWDDADADKSPFFDADGTCVWIDKGNGECEPENADAVAATDGAQPGKYTYAEDRGDFIITWEILLMGNGTFKLTETHEMSGNVNIYSGQEWTDNGDGTVTTGPWDDPDVDKSEFFAPNGECTWIIHDDGTCEPVSEGESGGNSGSVNPGKYTYVEDHGDFTVTWQILLMGNGGARVDEIHGLSGETTEHETEGWTDNGDGTVETGAWLENGDKPEFFAPNGVCNWKVNDDGTCEPIEGGSKASEGGEVNPGKYTYIEDKGPIQITWEILLMGNGNCRVDETDPGGETVQHEAAGWTDNGDGTSTTGAWTEVTDTMSDFFGADGSCTWKINADGTCEPVG